MAPVVVRVQSYGEILARHRRHREPKTVGADGAPCDRTAMGLLRRRPVIAAWLDYIGKKSNRLEDVELGLVHSWGEVCEVYEDPPLNALRNEILSILKRIPAAILARLAVVSRRTIKAIRNQHARPSPAVNRALLRAVQQHRAWRGMG